MQAPHSRTIVNVGPNARCAVCHKPIPEGSEAHWDYFKGVRHLECPAPQTGDVMHQEGDLMYKDGDTIITCGRCGSRRWTVYSGGHTISGPLFAIKQYRARARKADGVLTWRLDEMWGSYSSHYTAEREAEAHAETEDLEFKPNIVHGDRCNPVPVPPPNPEPEPDEDHEDLHDWCYSETVAHRMFEESEQSILPAALREAR